MAGAQWVFAARRQPPPFGRAEDAIRRGFAHLFAEIGVDIDADDPVALMVFPEMDARTMCRRLPRRAGAFSGNRRRA